MRRTKEVKIEAEGRDLGKVFFITEMPAMQAEKWGARAILAMIQGGAEIPDDLTGAGMAVLAAVGFRALTAMRFEDAEPLMDEMLRCVQAHPSEKIFRELHPSDLEEVKTILQLRSEVFELHTGFSIADLVLRLTSAMRLAGSSTTQMSPEPSASSLETDSLPLQN